jgi:transcriptional regulator with XRE-family HTH domain
MPQTKLDNYLRTYRKSRGFSQREVAFLLSCHSGAKVSRYERSKRIPPLETIFAYEVVLGIPARELFAGIQERAQRRALHRVRLLARRLARKAGDPALARKMEFLRTVAKRESEELRYEPIPET